MPNWKIAICKREVLAMLKFGGGSKKVPVYFIKGPPDSSFGKHITNHYIQLIPNAYIKLLNDIIDKVHKFKPSKKHFRYIEFSKNTDIIF